MTQIGYLAMAARVEKAPDKTATEDDPVVFVETPQPAVVSSLSAAMAAAAAEREASGSPVRVRVVAPYRVCHEGKAFVGGQTVSVPAAKADTWIKAGWVKPVAQKGRK